MATVTTPTTPRRPINRAETDRRVRHPLQALRGYIRAYVMLQGAAVGLLFLALWFWIGLVLDYGSFCLFGFDWLKRLTNAAGLETARGMQIFFLVILVLGLIGVVTMKVLLRLFREFRDAALALVLERRYPRQLGDRLITAVEMADPRVAQKYGFSQTMIDQTIADAADRVERVPVREVFNWGRLYWHWALALAATLGMYLGVGAGYCAIHQVGPGDYFWEFNHVAGIWTERNVLLQDTYWPPHAYLELVRFPETKEMRVARDETRPDVGVRALRTVLIVPKSPEAPEGIRALRVAELDKLGVPGELLDVPLPIGFSHWIIDLDDLDARVPAGAVPAYWHEQTSGFIRAELADPLGTAMYGRLIPQLVPKLICWRLGLSVPAERLAAFDPARMDYQRFMAHMNDPHGRRVLSPDTIQHVEALLNWKTWTWDNLALQLKREKVSEALRRDSPKAAEALERLDAALTDVINTPSMRRTIRQLRVPGEVQVQMRGASAWYQPVRPKLIDGTHKYSFPLQSITETVDFWVCAEDYCTEKKTIKLLPPPNVARLTIDKEEPAYLYFRVPGNEKKLKGLRQHFRGVLVSTTGPTSVIDVPFGTSVTVHATINRDLKTVPDKDDKDKKKIDYVLVEPPEKQPDKNVLTPRDKLEPSDERSFSVSFQNVRQRIEFDFVFRDEDNVKGRRHIIIQPLLDNDPVVVIVNSELDHIFRREGYNPGQSASRGKDRFVVTQDAYLPIRGHVSDERGLIAVEWVYMVRELDPKSAEVGKEVDPTDPAQNPTVRRTGLLAWALQVSPHGPGLDWISPAYVTWLAKGAGLEREKRVDHGIVGMENFLARYNPRLGEDATDDELPHLRRMQPRNRARLLTLLEQQRLDLLVKQLAHEGQTESFFGELLHLTRVPEELMQVGQGVGRFLLDPGLPRAHLVWTAMPDKRLDWKAMLKKDPEKALIKTYNINEYTKVEDHAPRWALPDLAERWSFDLKRQLPSLKTRDDTQNPHELTIWVQAMDNNVEASKPGMGKNKTALVFLVVTEDELLFEINKEEQFLAKQIKDTLDELEGHKTLLEADFVRAKPALAKTEIFGAVVDGLYTTLRMRSGTVKGVLKQYDRIVLEMQANRIKEARRDKVSFQVHVPLKLLTQSDFPATETTADNLRKALNTSIESLKKLAQAKNPDAKLEIELDTELDKHWKSSQQLHLQLSQLIANLRQVLHAMEEIGGADELRNTLIRILQQQRAAEQRLWEEYRRILEDLVGGALRD